MGIRRTAAATGAGLLSVAGVTMGAAATPAAASTLTCAAQPSIVQSAPAPGGTAVTVTAAPSGSYRVTQPTAGVVAVSGTPVANTGWTQQATVPSGARLRVAYHSTTSTALHRYTSSLNSTRTKLITHVVFCS